MFSCLHSGNLNRHVGAKDVGSKGQKGEAFCHRKRTMNPTKWWQGWVMCKIQRLVAMNKSIVKTFGCVVKELTPFQILPLHPRHPPRLSSKHLCFQRLLVLDVLARDLLPVYTKPVNIIRLSPISVFRSHSFSSLVSTVDVALKWRWRRGLCTPAKLYFWHCLWFHLLHREGAITCLNGSLMNRRVYAISLNCPMLILYSLIESSCLFFYKDWFLAIAHTILSIAAVIVNCIFCYSPHAQKWSRASIAVSFSN